LRRFAAEHGRQLQLSTEAMRKLESYDYPGNVRELENLIERAVALTSGPVIGVSDLPEIRATTNAVQIPTEFPAEGIDLDHLLADFERAWVVRALEHTKGVRKAAANLLGISFRSMRYRLAKLGFDKPVDGDDEPPTE
jgi:two-component system response regulator PilR (NtrC family)